MRNADVEFDLSKDISTIKKRGTENWKVTCVDTGDSTMTGGRLKRVKEYLNPSEPFFFTYGDGVGDINIKELIDHHKNTKKLATVTAVSPPGRFGVLNIQDQNVLQFSEKPSEGNTWINGGYFVLEPEVLEYIENDSTSWEKEPVNRLSQDKQLTAYKHSGFWQPMDTLQEKKMLNEMYENGTAPWKSW